MAQAWRKLSKEQLHKTLSFQLVESGATSLSHFETHLAAHNLHSVLVDQRYKAMCPVAWRDYADNIVSMPWRDILTLQESYADDGRFSDCASVQESVEWFDKYCHNNNWLAVDFVGDVKAILEREKPKKNLLLLRGQANGGKTVLAMSIVRSCLLFANLQEFNSTNNFYLQDAMHQRCILINEPRIAEDKIETFKNVSEGCPTAIEVKYEKGQILPRTPIIVTSNLPLDAYLLTNKSIQSSALRARTTEYRCNPFPALKELSKQLHPLMWSRLVNQYCE